MSITIEVTHTAGLKKGVAWMQIRQGREEDLLRLLEIERLTTEQYYEVGFTSEEFLPRTEEDFRFLLQGTTVLVAVDEYDRPLAFMSYYLIGQYVHLEEQGVDPQWQRLGIGQKLLAYYLQAGKTLPRCKYYSLLLFPDARWAWQFYTRFGFYEFDFRRLDSLQNESLERMIESELRGKYSRNRRLLLKEKR